MKKRNVKDRLRLLFYLPLASPIMALVGYISPARFSDDFLATNGWGGAILGFSLPIGYLFYVLVVDVLRFKFLEITDEDLKTFGDK